MPRGSAWPVAYTSGLPISAVAWEFAEPGGDRWPPIISTMALVHTLVWRQRGFTTQQFAHGDIKMGLNFAAAPAIVDPGPLGIFNSAMELDVLSSRVRTEATS